MKGPDFQLRLFHYWRSSSSWRVRWAIRFKNLTCDYVAVNLLKNESEDKENLLRNPLGVVPTLEVQGSSSNIHFLGESAAIIEWLEETYPNPSLFPSDGLLRARVRQLVQVINADTQPLQNLGVALEHSEDPEVQKKWNQKWIRKGLNAYQELLKDTSGKFSVGDHLTMADLFLIPQCYNALRNDLRLEEFPTIHKIYEEALKTDSCIASSPDRFKPQESS